MVLDGESTLVRKAAGCLIGGLVGDAMGTPTEGMSHSAIRERYGWVETFTGDGTDDTVMRDLLIEALVATDGRATLDHWAATWLGNWDAIFGSKQSKFFVSVIHTAQKLRRHAVPRMAALGNMPSSSSAMCIAPVGLVNACRPYQAAIQAYNLGSLIHVHDVGFCQDGAAAIATAVATACLPNADIETVIAAAVDAIIPNSGADMRARIARVLGMAAEADSFEAFCEAAYACGDKLFCRITCDSRETIPLTLAVLRLAEGDVANAVTYAANLGRDADTIAAMAGGIAGALCGVEGVPATWLQQLGHEVVDRQTALAQRLATTAQTKAEADTAALDAFAAISR